MQDPIILAPVIGSLLAWLLGYLAMRSARKRRYLRDTPISKAAGVFIGDVELAGTAESSQPLTSYLAEARCVHYSWNVSEEWRRVVTETYRDSKGVTRTRRRVESGWTTVASGGESSPFYLLDDTGYILVRPSGMTVEAPTVFSQTCSASNPLYYGKGPDGGIADSTGRRSFTESALPIHARIFIAGAARERKDVVAAEIAHSSDARFSLITTRSEDEIATGYAVWAWLIGVLGACFAVAGVLVFEAPRQTTGEGLILAGVVAFTAYLVLLALLWSLMTFNVLRALRERVRRGWSNIDVELKRRADLIPSLAETVKGVRGHEAETQALLARMRAQFAVTPAALRAGSARAEGIAPAVIALAERYPALKASENFLALQQELVRTESRIALARTYYNGLVVSFNARIGVAPDSLLARLGGLRPFPFFEASGFEREATKVEFAR